MIIFMRATVVFKRKKEIDKNMSKGMPRIFLSITFNKVCYIDG